MDAPLRAWRGRMALRVRPALSCVIPVAPDMTFRPQGRARLRQESPSPNGSGAAQPATPDDSAPERTLVVHAVAQLPSDYRALVRRAYYYRWTTAQMNWRGRSHRRRA